MGYQHNGSLLTSLHPSLKRTISRENEHEEHLHRLHNSEDLLSDGGSSMNLKEET